MYATLFILVAPVLFSASIYMMLGRMIRATDGEHLALIKRRFNTKIFVAGDILAFLIQGGGGGILSSATTASSLNLGKNLIIIGYVNTRVTVY
jgi:hypothetical protein